MQSNNIRAILRKHFGAAPNAAVSELLACTLEARIDGQFYYLHQIKEAIATGSDVYERIDRLEAETRRQKRQATLQSQLPKKEDRS